MLAKGRQHSKKGRRMRWSASAVALLILLTSIVWGAGAGLESVVRTTRDSWRNHSASGNVVVVEIEAKSVRALSHGAGPRGLYAAAIDRLQADGARLIGFDVDSSSFFQPTEDGARAA